MLVPKSVVRSKKERERESTCQDSPLSYYPHVKISLTVNPQLCNKQNVFAINLLLTTLTKSRSEHVASRNYVDPKLQKVWFHHLWNIEAFQIASSSFPAIGVSLKIRYPNFHCFEIDQHLATQQGPRTSRATDSSSFPIRFKRFSTNCRARSRVRSAKYSELSCVKTWHQGWAVGRGAKRRTMGFWEVGETNHLWGIMVDEWYEWIDETKDVSVDYDLVEVSDGVEKLQVLQYRLSIKLIHSQQAKWSWPARSVPGPAGTDPRDPLVPRWCVPSDQEMTPVARRAPWWDAALSSAAPTISPGAPRTLPAWNWTKNGNGFCPKMGYIPTVQNFIGRKWCAKSFGIEGTQKGTSISRQTLMSYWKASCWSCVSHNIPITHLIF